MKRLIVILVAILLLAAVAVGAGNEAYRDSRNVAYGNPLGADITLDSTSAIYYGGTATDTTWKIVRDGTKLSFLRCENTAIATVNTTPTAGGSGYTVNDVLTISEGSGGTVTATTVAGGAVTVISLTTAGYGYTTGAGKATTGGTGTGCTIEILTVESVYVEKGFFDTASFSVTDIITVTGNNAAVKVVDDSGNFGIIKAGNSQLTIAADPDSAVASTDIVFDMDGAEVARFQQGGEFQSLDGIIAKKGFAAQLWDVAGGNFETAVVNTEYYSPNQQGGIYGTIYRQYFNTSLPSYLTSGNNVSALIDYAIQFLSEGTNIRGVAHGNTSATDTSDKRCSIWLTGATGSNNLQIDKESTGDDYEPVRGWVDYTK